MCDKSISLRGKDKSIPLEPVAVIDSSIAASHQFEFTFLFISLIRSSVDIGF